jgi:hypothetical protein
VLSFSLRSPLTEPPSVIDVAYWHIAAPDVCDDITLNRYLERMPNQEHWALDAG